MHEEVVSWCTRDATWRRGADGARRRVSDDCCETDGGLCSAPGGGTPPAPATAAPGPLRSAPTARHISGSRRVSRVDVSRRARAPLGLGVGDGRRDCAALHHPAPWAATVHRRPEPSAAPGAAAGPRSYTDPRWRGAGSRRVPPRVRRVHGRRRVSDFSVTTTLSAVQINLPHCRDIQSSAWRHLPSTSDPDPRHKSNPHTLILQRGIRSKHPSSRRVPKLIP